MRAGTYKPPTQTKAPERHTYTEVVQTGSPFSSLIKDWELDSLEAVARVDVSNRLGVYFPLVGVSDDDKLLVQSANWKTQDITWYAMVAAHLTTKVE